MEITGDWSQQLFKYTLAVYFYINSYARCAKRRGRGSCIFTLSLCLLFLLDTFPQDSQCARLPAAKSEHSGVCPNKLNANLWVDAQSTCERECEVDQVLL